MRSAKEQSVLRTQAQDCRVEGRNTSHDVPVSVSGVAGELGGSGVTDADTAGSGYTGSQHSRSGNSLPWARRISTAATTNTLADMLNAPRRAAGPSTSCPVYSTTTSGNAPRIACCTDR